MIESKDDSLLSETPEDSSLSNWDTGSGVNASEVEIEPGQFREPESEEKLGLPFAPTSASSVQYTDTESSQASFLQTSETSKARSGWYLNRQKKRADRKSKPRGGATDRTKRLTASGSREDLSDVEEEPSAEAESIPIEDSTEAPIEDRSMRTVGTNSAEVLRSPAWDGQPSDIPAATGKTIWATDAGFQGAVSPFTVQDPKSKYFAPMGVDETEKNSEW